MRKYFEELLYFNDQQTIDFSDPLASFENVENLIFLNFLSGFLRVLQLFLVIGLIAALLLQIAFGERISATLCPSH